MDSKLFKKAKRFIGDLIFITIPISKAESFNDARVESQPYVDEFKYTSLRRPKKQEFHPPMPALPTLIHMDELELLVSKMEENSAEYSLPHSIKRYTLETLV